MPAEGNMLVLRHGRPENCEGRLAKEIRTYDFLDALAVPYDYIDHEPMMTMDMCAKVDDVLAATICKNLFLCNRQATQFYLLMIRGAKRFKTKDLSAQLGISRLSFASDEYMEEFLDITPGSLSVMGLMNDTNNRVQLLIDKDILQGDEIGFHPCINTSSLRVKISDLIDIIIPALKHDPIYVDLPEVSLAAE